HDVVESVIAWRPHFLIDIGAAEGYYAVGFGRRLPETRIVAFEADEAARYILAAHAEINQVRNITIAGLADCDRIANCVRLDELDRCRMVVVCDCEGHELDLMCKKQVPLLENAMIICELHEFAKQGITGELIERFSATHRIDLIRAEPRCSEDFPFKTF